MVQLLTSFFFHAPLRVVLFARVLLAVTHVYVCLAVLSVTATAQR